MTLWISFFLLFVNFAGYVLVLFLLSRWKPSPTLKRSADGPWDKVVVLIPVYNEADQITEKVENTLQQEYPADRLEVWIIDGGSTDGTPERISPRAGLRVIRCPRAGKVHQLNHVLTEIPAGTVVVVSDADALLQSSGALRETVSLLSQPGVGLVGGWGMPHPSRALGAEQAYWDKQNRLRYLESRACTSSIVTALFYAFRHPLVMAFPEDCVADDVYVSFLSHGQNLRVIYTPEIEVWETRQPPTMRVLFWHKLRKAHAYTTELLRLLPRLTYLGKRRKFLFLFKVFQFFYLPWVSLIYVITSVLHLYRGSWKEVLLSFTLLFFGTAAASLLLYPPPGRKRGGLSPIPIFYTFLIFTLVNAVLILNGFIYAFWRQDSRYQKVEVP